jgi:predicted sulfurtransferase
MREMKINVQESRAVSNERLPLIPTNAENYASQILFYQYVEPVWTKAKMKRVLQFMNETGDELGVSGRGRIASEGVNCTLTARTAEKARRFCERLREFDRAFEETDFKITDFVAKTNVFKRLTIVAKDELVAYGLAGERAPSLKQNKGRHLDAVAYHEMLKMKDAVVIDVRNHYEVDIGRIEPPEGGAEFLNPEMRNSHEFPKWLNLPETKRKLEGKHVMMYCTGGIRCERASALISQMERVGDLCNTKGISMVQGGVDRYLKTFPEGGFWKGKNYLFDLRDDQKAEDKDDSKVEKETESKCAKCDMKWSKYIGKFVCGDLKCKVPILICNLCKEKAKRQAKTLRCPLCKSGKDLRSVEPVDSAAQKRKLNIVGNVQASSKRPRKETKTLFLGKLPLAVTAEDIKDALKLTELGATKSALKWMLDSKTGFFYGSAIIKLESKDLAKRALEKYRNDPPRVNKKLIRVGYYDEKNDANVRVLKSGPRPPLS